MTPELAAELLPWAITAQTLISVAVGYIAGVQRGYARLGYWSETLPSILATLQPHCGGR